MICRTIIVVVVLLTSCTGLTGACHPSKNEDRSDDGENQDVSNRKKRAIPIFPSLGLEDYFVLCMRSYRRFRPIDIRTIVSFTIDQTRWFESSDQSFCSSDTVRCWQNILYGYMNRNSELFTAAIQCMQRYGDYRGGRKDTVEPVLHYFPMPARRRRYKRQLYRGDISPTPEFYQRNQAQSSGLPINSRQAAGRLQLMFPALGDFGSLIEFFQRDTICSRQFCDCSGIRVPNGEVCGQNWYTRIGAMTRMSSPLRVPLVFALNSLTSATERALIEQNQRRIELSRRRRQRRLLNNMLAIYALFAIRQPTTNATSTVAARDSITTASTVTAATPSTETTSTISTTAAAATTTATTTTTTSTTTTTTRDVPLGRR